MAVTVADLNARLSLDTSRFQAGTRQAALLYDQFGRALVSQTAESGKAVEGLGQKTARLTGTVETLHLAWIKAAAGIYAAWRTVGKVWDLAGSAADLQERVNSLDALGAQAGLTGKQILSGMQEAARGLVSLSEAGDMAAAAMNLGIPIAQITRFVRVSEQLSDVIGGDVKQSFDRMTVAAASGRTMTLAQMGIIVDLEKEYKKYAAGVGKTVEGLSAQEQQTVRLNVILAKAEEKIAALGAPTDTARDKMDRFTKAMSDLGTTLGNAVLPPLSRVAEELTKVMKHDPKDLERLAQLGMGLPPGIISRPEMPGEPLTTVMPQAWPATPAAPPGVKFGETAWADMTDAQKTALDAWVKGYAEYAQSIIDLDEKLNETTNALDEEAQAQKKAVAESGLELAKKNLDEELADLEKASDFRKEMRERDNQGWVAYIEELERLWDLEAKIELERLDSVVKKREEAMNQWRESFRDVFSSISDGISRTVQGVQMGTQTMSQAFSNLAQNVLLSIQDMIIRRGLAELEKWLEKLIFTSNNASWISTVGSLLGSYFGSSSAGGSGTSSNAFSTTSMQGGGILTEPVFGVGRSGRRYTFAETGPEEFGGVGNVGGRGGTVVQVFQPQVGIPEAVRREVWAMMPAIRASAMDGVLAARGRGGEMSRAMGARR